MPNVLSAQHYYNAQFAGHQLPHSSASGQAALGVGSQVYSHLNVHPSAQRSGAPVLSQSMDQSFMLDANNVINAIMQQQQFGAGVQGSNGLASNAALLGGGPGSNPAAAGYQGVAGAGAGYYTSLTGDPSGLAGLSNSYYQSIVSQQHQMQLNQMLMQLHSQEQVKRQQLERAMLNREAELAAIRDELVRQKDDAVQTIKAQAQAAVKQAAQEIRTDREDEVQQDFEQLRLEKEMSLKHQKELVF